MNQIELLDKINHIQNKLSNRNKLLELAEDYIFDIEILLKELYKQAEIVEIE